jgi:hypothetical protein
MQSVANGGQYWASGMGISAKAAVYLREVPFYGKGQGRTGRQSGDDVSRHSPYLKTSSRSGHRKTARPTTSCDVNYAAVVAERSVALLCSSKYWPAA